MALEYSEKVGELLKSWFKAEAKASIVFFEHGTAVLIPTPKDDETAKAAAIALLKRYGPVLPGSAAGDFNVFPSTTEPYWIVTGHHKQIVTIVGHNEISPDSDTLLIGIFGRNKRDLDGKGLKIVHLDSPEASADPALTEEQK